MKKKKKKNFLAIEFDRKVLEARRRAADEAGCGCRDDGSCNHISATWRRRINILKHQRGPLVVGLYGMRSEKGFWTAVDGVADMPKNIPTTPRADAAKVLETLRTAAARKAFHVKCKCPPWEYCEHINYQDKQIWFGRWKKLKAMRSTEIGPLVPAVGTKEVWSILDHIGAHGVDPPGTSNVPVVPVAASEPIAVLQQA